MMFYDLKSSDLLIKFHEVARRISAFKQSNDFMFTNEKERLHQAYLEYDLIVHELRRRNMDVPDEGYLV